ncbi:MAG: AmmeMemoRadiSam system protein A [Acidobacteria bacterium]|nr:AmmeMemoRadiSam system protein A [Acidobacteriota bacterium]
MFLLSDNDQKTLLEIARNSVRSYLAVATFDLPEISSDVLTQSHGVFVSIHKHGELRGCIGNVHPVGPLYRVTAECAIAAAFGDPRFIPLMKKEIDVVNFEISVLSPMELVEDVKKIEVGRHGLMISKGKAKGLLLPQVAAMYGWNRERFLEETSRKAGLALDDWKEGATIHYFTAIVFGEKRLHITATP